MKNKIITQLYEIKSEIQEAIKDKTPVVSLETAVLTHGLPYPHNVNLILSLENIVKSYGVIPATIAVLKGKIKVGLEVEDIEYLGKSKSVMKLSARDISYALTKNLSGGTTVSASILICSMLGLKIFSTGGIGGIHFGFEEGFIDISSDLTYMSEHSLVIVSSGAKAILDIEKTIELLETLGIPTIGYQTSLFPAFYSKDTPFKINSFFEEVEDLSNYLKIQLTLNNKSVLVLNPITDQFAIPFKEMQLIIKEAINSSKQANIKGQSLTPYLLQKVNEYSNNRTLDANLNLLQNNARLASLIALQLSKS